MITMVVDPQATFNQLRNPLRGPQLRAVPLRHGPFGQEPYETRFLRRREPRGPARRGLGLQCLWPARLQRIAPPQDTASVAADPARDLMQGQLLLEEGNHSVPTRFQRFRRTLRSHGDTPFPDVSIVLHYLCGSQ